MKTIKHPQTNLRSTAEKSRDLNFIPPSPRVRAAIALCMEEANPSLSRTPRAHTLRLEDALHQIGPVS